MSRESAARATTRTSSRSVDRRTVGVQLEGRLERASLTEHLTQLADLVRHAERPC